MAVPYTFEILPPAPHGGKFNLFGDDYCFDFPRFCAFCGAPCTKSSPVHLLSPFGERRQSVWIRIPYCDEHLKRVRILTQVKFGIYILSYVVTALLLMLFSELFLHVTFPDLAGFLSGLLTLGAFTIFIWGPLVYPLFRFVLIKPLIKTIDPDGLYQPNTNTLGLTVQLRSLSILVGFANPEPARTFALANTGNPRVKPLRLGRVRAA